MAEGTPLERVQVVNSGARVQIPPSPFAQLDWVMNFEKKFKKFLTSQTAYDKLNKLSKRQERKFFWKHFQ